MAIDSCESSYHSTSTQYIVEGRLAAGDTHVSAWWTEGEPISLELAVVDYRAALTACSLDEAECRIRAQISLSDALRMQFEDGLGGKGEEELFREALNLAESAVTGATPLSTLHMHALRALGHVLARRFHTKEHLPRAMDTLCGLVDALSDSHSDLLITALALYSSVLMAQFHQQSGDQQLLSRANEAVDRAITLLPKGKNIPYDLVYHAQWAVRSHYGSSSHNKGAIDEAITIMQSLIDRSPTRHPHLHIFWSRLAYAYWQRYELWGSDQDLDSLVVARSNARELTPRSHPLWANAEASHAVVLRTRFRVRGELKDLQDAIDVTRASVHYILSAPAGQTVSAGTWVNNLAEFLTIKYAQTGELELLDEAIDLLWNNLKRLPLVRRGVGLHSMSVAYRFRFSAQGRLSDLQTAGELLEQALECPHEARGHAEIAYTLADVFLAMYNEDKEDSTLNKSISVLQKFLASDGIQPQMRSHHQSLLGLALMSRAGIESSADIIEESALCQKSTLQLLPQEHPLRFVCHFRLGLAEFQRFAIGRERKGIDNSIRAFNEALSIMPTDHADRSTCLSHLSTSLLAFSELEGSRAAFFEALERLQEAARHSSSWVADRYNAASQWATASHRRGYRSEAIEAYRLAISLLPELVSVRLEDELRVQHIRKQAREVPQDAAACAIELGMPEVAVEFLEAGRTLLWNARQELRTDLARLREIAPDLAKELAQTNTVLEFRPPPESIATSVAETESERRRLHRLASRRTELIDQIRSHPGFEQFLCPPTFGSLKCAAAHGPIVVLNSSAYRCDAIVIQGDEQLAVIPLPDVRYDQIKTEARTLQYWLAVASRDSKGRQFLDIVLQRLLDWLWKCLGSPICSALREYTAGPKLRRVWWCPTGALSFLPIHACGPCDGKQPGMGNLVISSYTPTISALLRAQKPMSTLEFASKSVLVISQPTAPGHPPLPGAMYEMAILEQLFPHNGTFLVGPQATLSTVEAELRHNGWLHVITHGSQNSLNPLESSLAMYDGPLKLSRLSQARLPHAEFAFLSACHSAKGTTWVPDESMHLAAGMMFAGFRSVVATSWGIADRDGPAVARVFYKYLIGNSVPLSATDAAEALHMAVQTLRKSGVSASRWVPFIHLGA